MNFSPLHGGAIVFESRLSSQLKQDLAHRLLDYPDILSKYPLLKAGLSCLAANTLPQRALKTAIAPLGTVHNQVQRELDYTRLGLWWLTNGPRYTPGISEGARHPARIDWDTHIRDAAAASKQQSLQTTYCVGPRTGFDDKQRTSFTDPKHPERTPDENFNRLCDSSKEWTDYRLLLRTARELKIDLLVICQPINANFSQLQGINAQSRTNFYQRLRHETTPFGVPLLTYPTEGENAHFFQDAGHPTALTWLMYNRALDAFYHEPTRSEG